jgi:hypothetical protein
VAFHYPKIVIKQKSRINRIRTYQEEIFLVVFYQQNQGFRAFCRKKSFPTCSQAVKKFHQIPSILLQQFKIIQMAANIITTEDLENFKVELLEELKEILGKYEDKNSPVQEEKAWIKSHQVQRMLGISPGTLQTLRINGTIPFSKIGGVLFYSKSDILKMLEENRKNHL